MKSITIEKSMSNLLSNKQSHWSYGHNGPLFNWYKMFKNHLISSGYAVKEMDVNNLLFEVEKKELPAYKIISLKINAKEETQYLLLDMKDGSSTDYERYRCYYQYLLDIRESYPSSIDVILIFNTKLARILHKSDDIHSNKLKVLLTSLDDPSFKLHV